MLHHFYNLIKELESSRDGTIQAILSGVDHAEYLRLAGKIAGIDLALHEIRAAQSAAARDELDNS